MRVKCGRGEEVRVRWGRRGEEGVRVRVCGTYLCSDPSFEVIISQSEAEELQGGSEESGEGG